MGRVAEFLCSGYDCDCGTRVTACRFDGSLPLPKSPSPDYLTVVSCSHCFRTRALNWNQLMNTPRVWVEWKWLTE
jgi:hypothetical protein